MNKHQLKKWREDYISWDAPCLGEGFHLHVHFDEKDDVKRLGARWNPDPSGKGGHWWMPKKALNLPCQLECDIYGEGWSGTILDWLNNHKMVAGQYLPIAQICNDYLDCNQDLRVEQYNIVSQDRDAEMDFQVYPDLDVVQLTGTVYRTMESARTLWNDMMKVGWRKVISTNSEVSS